MSSAVTQSSLDPRTDVSSNYQTYIPKRRFQLKNPPNILRRHSCKKKYPKGVKRTHWKEEEVSRLIQVVAENAQARWEDIARIFGNGRTKNQCYKKFYDLKNRKKAIELKSDDAPSAAAQDLSRPSSAVTFKEEEKPTFVPVDEETDSDRESPVSFQEKEEKPINIELSPHLTGFHFFPVDEETDSERQTSVSSPDDEQFIRDVLDLSRFV